MAKQSKYKDSIDFLKARLPYLAGPTKDIYHENMTLSESKNGPWSVIKELFLAYYAPKYHDILRRYNWIQSLVYIDLFSGPGLQRISEFQTVFPGSPITIDRCLRKEVVFDHFYLSDIEPDYIRQLREIFHNSEKCSFYDKDVNENVREIIRDIEKMNVPGKQIHALVFIDPYALQLDWDSLVAITKAKFGSDLIICLMTTEILRVIRAARSEGRTAEGDARKLNRFFGCNDWTTINTDDAVMDLYLKQLSSIERDQQEEVIVYKNENKNTGYRMIVAVKGKESVRRTFLDIVKDFRTHSDKLDGTIIRKAIRHYFDSNSKGIDESWD